MPASMTGFGSGQAELEGRRIEVEIRTVNHRYLDVRWHVFGEIAVDRPALERRLTEVLHRGRVDIRVVLETDGGGSEWVDIDENVVGTLLGSGRELGQRHGLEPITRVSQLLSLPGVVRRRAVAMGPEHRLRLWEAFEDALGELLEMRVREGERTVAHMLEHVARVEEDVRQVEARCQPGVDERLERMKRRLHALLEGYAVDEARLLQEAAILADRVDVTEELERLESHLGQMKKLLRDDKPVGRRIDFLLQEMNREANTIGSKSAEVDIAHRVVDLKAELEKMREQGQNIE